MQQLPQAFAAMAQCRQFMLYLLTPNVNKPGKMNKLPANIWGQIVSAHDSTQWVSAQEAIGAAQLLGPQYGVAFVFTKEAGFWFIDLDNHFDGAAWSPMSQQICAMFAGAAMELSQSGKGLHLFGRGTAPEHGCRNDALGLEFYTEGRFVALTGVQAMGDSGTDHTAALAAFVATYMPMGAGKHSGAFELTTGPVAEWRGPVADDDLLRRALNSRSAAATFGANASFADLWNADMERLRVAYPDPARPYDASAADAALVSHLSFWTGAHGERIERLMRQSALKREKWDRDDYLPRTICEVIARGGSVLTDKEAEPPQTVIAAKDAPMQRVVTGNTFLDLAQQQAAFKGCVYIVNRHRVLVPGGELLKPDQFKALYGGYVYTLDAANTKTTRNAYEAFTESQQLRPPIATSICFRPDLPSAEIVDIAGKTYANTWWPAEVKRTVGDPTPFLRHLELVLPDERDRGMFLAYMCACVQYPGKKFSWCPVLQGVEGNGKTAFSWCVAEALGQHYVHWLDAKALASDFNAFLSNKLLIAVEELRAAEHQEEIIKSLYTIIAGGAGVQIQAKGVDQVSMQICCNLMATTNHRNAIRKTPDNARRFGIFFSAQQTKADIERCGMGGDYFPKFYGWLREQGGFAIVSELLHSMPIPREYDPLHTLHRAPNTSTTEMAIVESLGGVEQHIVEAVAQGIPGFMGGWVSSIKLEHLLETLNLAGKITHQKRKQMLLDMGYITHPALADGRTNNPVQPDGRKPQLFVKAGSPLAQIQGAAEVARAYTQAQSMGIAHY